MKTILWIYDMPLDPEAGGTERITSLVAEGLKERGYDTLGIMVFKDGSEEMTYDEKLITDLYTFLKDHHVEVVINQIAYAEWLLRDFLVRGGEKWHEEGGRIISCLHFDPNIPSFAQLLKSVDRLGLRQRLLLARYYLLQPLYQRKKEEREGRIYNYIYDHSDALVCLSKTHFPYMEKVMKRKDYSKLYAIGNTLTFPDISTPEILDHKEKIVMVCARMSEYHKRITLVLKTWKRIKRDYHSKDWRLVLVGEGPDLERYKRIVATGEIPDVEFTGRTNPEPYYRRASILFVTSSAEGWGLTITEAMQRGVLPVVMNSSPVYSDIITNCFDGFLAADGNVKALAHLTVYLMTDARRLRAMQSNALNSAPKFSLPKTIDKWENLLSAI